MINAIVFSKDRACQCDLTLFSLLENASNIFDSIHVLYTFSNDKYELGYRKLVKKWKKHINFIKQQNFKDDLIRLTRSTSLLTSYFTDDDILYRKVNDVKPIMSIMNNNTIATFSLRLGLNLEIQDWHRQTPIVKPAYTTNQIYDMDVIMWNWRTLPNHTNFAYPLSVDGHIFRTNDISNLIDKFDYDNPNSFEGRIQQFNNKIADRMASFSHSVLVNTPINRVQETCTNLAGVQYGISSEFLNQCWLDGFSIPYQEINFNNIVGCHQELELKLQRRKSLKEKSI